MPATDPRDSLRGYVSHGAGYWPGARYFTILGIDNDGDSTGAGADLCRACVAKVAKDALAVIDGAVKVPWVGSDLGKVGYLGDGALAVCGADAAYEIWGVTDTHTAGYGEPTTCAECNETID